MAIGNCCTFGEVESVFFCAVSTAHFLFLEEKMSDVNNSNELVEALQKRAIITNKDLKRKKLIIIIGAIILFIAIALLIIFSTIKNNKRIEYNNRLRNIATEEMSWEYTNVYADVISIEPVYFSGNPYLQSSYGYRPEAIDDVICECKTVEGKTIWAAFFYQDYPGYDDSLFFDESSFKKQVFPKNNPMRITGDIETAHNIAENLEKKIGDAYVLDVDIKD